MNWTERKTALYLNYCGEFKAAQELTRLLDLEEFWNSAPLFDPEHRCLITLDEIELWT